MAKFHGVVGYAKMEKNSLGVVTEQITKRVCSGDMIKNTRRLQSADQVNDNIVLVNEVSIVADPFAVQNFQMIRYVEYMGAKWKVTNASVEYPRLILTLGGVYNAE